MTDKILFICTANVCRSPMAEAIFNALAEEKGLALRAESAGVRALVNEPITPKARTALGEMGVYAEAHRARQVSRRMVEEADLTLVMSPQHVAELGRAFGDPLPCAVHLLPRYVSGTPNHEGIPDPYGGTMTSFRTAVRQIFDYIDLLVGRIGKGQGLPPVDLSDNGASHRIPAGS